METNNLFKKLSTSLLLILVLAFSANAHKAKRHIKKKSIRSTSIRASKALTAMKINNVEFGFNKVEIPAKCYAGLDHVFKLMADSSASLKLGGYADSKGGYVYNWKLSKQRADAVKAYLVSKGADSAKIAATEYGYTHPIASNATPTGRQKNRRVEIKFAN